MTKWIQDDERRQRVPKAGCNHRLRPAASVGWFVCACGKEVGVCFDCVPSAPSGFPLCLCEEHRMARRVGVYWQPEQEPDGSAL